MSIDKLSAGGLLTGKIVTMMNAFIIIIIIGKKGEHTQAKA